MRVHDSSDNIYVQHETWRGLGHWQTVALYDKKTEVLEIMEGCARKLDSILKELRRTMSVKPVTVKYW